MSMLPPAPAPPADPDPLEGMYGCMEEVTVILPAVDLTAPTGEVWWAEEADGLPTEEPDPPKV